MRAMHCCHSWATLCTCNGLTCAAREGGKAMRLRLGSTRPGLSAQGERRTPGQGGADHERVCARGDASLHEANLYPAEHGGSWRQVVGFGGAKTSHLTKR